MEWIEAKQIVQAVKPTDNYISRDYNMNIYRGCCHGCVYCDSRSDCYQIEDFGRVRAKKDAVAIIERELGQKRRTGLIGTGAMSDPYNPFEAKLRLTRGALEAIARHGFGIDVITKSALVTRDIDLFAQILKNAPAAAHITITAAEDNVSRAIEPYAPPSSERFAALEKLSAAGVHTGVLITPCLPWMTDSQENVATIVERAADGGARHAVFFPGMTLRSGNREHYYAALDRLYPGLRVRYEKTFGNAYECASPKAGVLWDAFTDACAKHGMLNDFPSINRAIRDTGGPRQISLLHAD